MAEPAPLRRIAIDRGGTFTDVVAERSDGSVEVLKLLSVDPGRYDDAAIEAVRRLTGIASGPLPALDVRIGTTIATNALLERGGEPTLLAITRGFGDALTIGYQDRPDIFAREIKRPPPLAAQVVRNRRADRGGRLRRATTGLCKSTPKLARNAPKRGQKHRYCADARLEIPAKRGKTRENRA